MSRTWQGFDGRVFLNESEHQTYLRRPPVRYAAKSLPKHEKICDVCSSPETAQNKLQASHMVPFGAGVLVYRFTPEWLDGQTNLKWAHSRVCNKKVELSNDAILGLIAKLADTIPEWIAGDVSWAGVSVLK